MTRPIYHARPDARFYGHAIGIIVLDCVQPNIPGDVANASTYRYPVLFEPVDGLTTIAAKSGDPALEQAVVEAACRLEARGVKAISSNCGFLHRYQEAIARAVRIPVLMSALQQLPMVLAGLSKDAEVGVITADAGMLGEALLQLAVGDRTDRLRVTGLQDSPEFRRAMRNQTGALDAARLEHEVAEAAAALVATHPAIQAIVLECAVFPPYSRAVSQRCALPVFDFITMLDWLFAGTHPREYTGFY